VSVVCMFDLACCSKWSCLCLPWLPNHSARGNLKQNGWLNAKYSKQTVIDM